MLLISGVSVVRFQIVKKCVLAAGGIWVPAILDRERTVVKIHLWDRD